MELLGKPSAPEGPLEVSDVTKTTCKLSWKKPADDGGVPIKEYEIEKMDMETGKWVRVGKVAANVPGSPGYGDHPETTVTGLNPNSEYKFRVKAVNDEGDSEPLTTTKPIVAKNPYGMLHANFSINRWLSLCLFLMYLYFVRRKVHVSGRTISR